MPCKTFHQKSMKEVYITYLHKQKNKDLAEQQRESLDLCKGKGKSKLQFNTFWLDYKIETNL